jgi:hypothetical protein
MSVIVLCRGSFQGVTGAISVQSAMLASIFTGAQKSKKEQAEIVETSLSLINQLSMALDRSIHPMYVRAIEAEALDMIGQYELLHGDLTEVEAIKCLGYLENYRKMREEYGSVSGAAQSEARISRFKAICIRKFGAQEAFGRPESKEQVLERQQTAYQLLVENRGDVEALNVGFQAATSLQKTLRRIEAWRLLKRLIAVSNQHHGREHATTTYNIFKINCRLQDAICCIVIRGFGV